MMSLRDRLWEVVRRDVVLARGARENAHVAMLEVRLQVFRHQQAAVALAAAGRAGEP